MSIERRTVVAGALAVAGAAAFGRRPAFAADPIRIGAILPLSGPAEIVGTKIRLGIEIARDQINAGGGVLGRPIEIVFRDDKADPTQSVAAARELTAAGVNLLIGPALSTMTIAVLAVIQSLNGVLIGPNTVLDSFTHETFNRNFFRATDNNYMRCRGLARVMAERFPNVTQWGGIIFDVSVGHDSWKEFSSGLRDYYPKYAKKDVTILDVNTAKFGSTDYKVQIFKAMQSPAQGLFNLTFGSDMITLWKQAKTLGLSDKLKVVADASGELDLPVMLGKDMPTELWSNLHWFYQSKSGGKVNADLVAEVEKRTGDKTPSSLIGTGHGALRSYAAAIAMAKETSTPAVIDALEKVQVETAQGLVRYRKEDHQKIGPVSVLGSVPTPTGADFKNYIEVPGNEIAELATPGQPLKY